MVEINRHGLRGLSDESKDQPTIVREMLGDSVPIQVIDRFLDILDRYITGGNKMAPVPPESVVSVLGVGNVDCTDGTCRELPTSDVGQATNLRVNLGNRVGIDDFIPPIPEPENRDLFAGVVEDLRRMPSVRDHGEILNSFLTGDIKRACNICSASRNKALRLLWNKRMHSLNGNIDREGDVRMEGEVIVQLPFEPENVNPEWSEDDGHHIYATPDTILEWLQEDDFRMSEPWEMLRGHLDTIYLAFSQTARSLQQARVNQRTDADARWVSAGARHLVLRTRRYRRVLLRAFNERVECQPELENMVTDATDLMFLAEAIQNPINGGSKRTRRNRFDPEEVWMTMDTIEVDLQTLAIAVMRSRGTVRENKEIREMRDMIQSQLADVENIVDTFFSEDEAVLSRIRDLKRMSQVGLIRGGSEDAKEAEEELDQNTNTAPVFTPGLATKCASLLNAVPTFMPAFTDPVSIRATYIEAMVQRRRTQVAGNQNAYFQPGIKKGYSMQTRAFGGNPLIPIDTEWIARVPYGIQTIGNYDSKVEVALNGVYAQMVGVAEGTSAAEVSGAMRIRVDQISSNTEIKHASVVAAGITSATTTSTADIVTKILLYIASADCVLTGGYDYYEGTSSILNGFASVEPNPLTLYPISGAPIPNPVPADINARLITMTDAVNAYYGIIQPPAGWEVNNWGTTVAVVPIRTEWLDDPVVNVPWTLAHLEYPFRAWGLDATQGWDTAAGFVNYGATPWIPNAVTTGVPGPKQRVLYVLADHLQTGGNVTLFVGGGAGQFVTYAGNNFAGVDHPIADFLTGFGGNVEEISRWVSTLARWRRICGNQRDYDTAMFTVAEAMSTMCQMPARFEDTIGPVIISQEVQPFDLPPGTAATQPTQDAILAYMGLHSSPSGNRMRWHTGAAMDQALTAYVDFGCRVPAHDPITYLGYAARFYEPVSPLDDTVGHYAGYEQSRLSHKAICMFAIYDLAAESYQISSRIAALPTTLGAGSAQADIMFKAWQKACRTMIRNSTHAGCDFSPTAVSCYNPNGIVPLWAGAPNYADATILYRLGYDVVDSLLDENLLNITDISYWNGVEFTSTLFGGAWSDFVNIEIESMINSETTRRLVRDQLSRGVWTVPIAYENLTYIRLRSKDFSTDRPIHIHVREPYMSQLTLHAFGDALLPQGFTQTEVVIPGAPMLLSIQQANRRLYLNVQGRRSWFYGNTPDITKFVHDRVPTLMSTGAATDSNSFDPTFVLGQRLL